MSAIIPVIMFIAGWQFLQNQVLWAARSVLSKSVHWRGFFLWMYECVYSLLTWCQFSNQSMLPTTFLLLSLMLTYFLLNGQHSEAIYCCCCYACITLHLSMTSIKAAKLWCYILWSLDGIWCSRIYSISFSKYEKNQLIVECL